MSFNKKPNSTTTQKTLVKMTYISLQVHWLAEHIPKSVKYKFTKYSLNYFFAYSYSFTNKFIFVALLYFLYFKSDIVPLMHL